MTKLDVRNPFPGATTFYMEETDSTMTEAKRLANGEFVSGSVIVADRQTAGRGRVEGRAWESPRGLNLLFTVIVKNREGSHDAFPLKVGLACARALDIIKIERGISVFDEHAEVKWPNDVFLGGRKAAGILCENARGVLFAGIGVNVNQTEFSPALREKATSLKLCYRTDIDRLRVLELILDTLAFTLVDPDWNAQLNGRLWKRGERISFIPGAADSGAPFEAILDGVAKDGALLLRRPGEIRAEGFVTGEIVMGQGRG